MKKINAYLPEQHTQHPKLTTTMRVLLIVALCNLSSIVYSQHTPKQWFTAQGDSTAMLLNFKGSFNVTLVNNPQNCGFTFTSAAIGGGDSSLLFYTNGTAIYNNLYLKIKNGDTLNPNANTLFSINSGQQLPQGAVFIPHPGDTNLFYLFHHGQDSFYQCPNISSGIAPHILYYTIIDRSLDNGKGGVVSKNNLLLNDWNGCGIMAVKHGNGHDWWIVVKHFFQPIWFSFLVNDNGILGPYQQTIGTGTCSGYSSLKYSALTNQVIGFKSHWVYDSLRHFEVWDFNRCTGQFSNQQTIEINHKNFMTYSGALEVSPNGRFVYVAAWDILYQYDLTAANIAASRITVDSVSYTDFVFNRKGWFFMQAAPDGKIYNVSRPGINHYSVINYPDSLGLACNAVAAGVSLPDYHNFDVPNIPLYELGPLAGSACDTLTGIPLAPKGGDTVLKIYPNPASNQLTIRSEQLAIGKEVTVTVYDVLGKVQMEEKTTTNTIDIRTLAAGIYMIQVQQGDKIFYGRFVKE